MNDTLNYALLITGIVGIVLAGGCLIATAAMFFGFRIPALIKELRGKMTIEYLADKRNQLKAEKGGKNVFEEFQKNAKLKDTGTLRRPSMAASSRSAPKRSSNQGTTVLSSKSNPNFVIVKNLMFVSTSEVLRDD